MPLINEPITLKDTKHETLKRRVTDYEEAIAVHKKRQEEYIALQRVDMERIDAMKEFINMHLGLDENSDFSSETLNCLYQLKEYIKSDITHAYRRAEMQASYIDQLIPHLAKAKNALADYGSPKDEQEISRASMKRTLKALSCAESRRVGVGLTKGDDRPYIQVGLGSLIMRPNFFNAGRYPWIKPAGELPNIRIPRSTVIIYPDSGAVRITHVADEANQCRYCYGGSEPQVHPHVLNGGEPCFGDFAGPIREAIADRDWAVAIGLIQMFLEQADPEDTAGQHWINGVMPQEGQYRDIHITTNNELKAFCTERQKRVKLVCVEDETSPGTWYYEVKEEPAAAPVPTGASRPDTRWIAWHGGNCPLPGDHPVVCRRQDGVILANDTAGRWNWGHGLGASTITAYRPEREEGWVEWHGGQCPVASDAEVEVSLRGTEPMIEQAGALGWSHSGGSYDIVSYRVLTQPTNGWVEWHGGERPVPAGTRVRVRLESTLTSDISGCADELRWSRSGDSSDIVAYCIEEESEWVGWHDGRCPVDNNTEIEVRLRDGSNERGAADLFDWDFDNVEKDIVAYRILSVEAAAA